MNKKDFDGIFSKAFGKDKDEKVHSIAMLIIYFIFISIVVIAVRINSDNTIVNNKDDSNGNENIVSTPTPSPTPDATPKTTKTSGDINYKYSYTITLDGKSEIYLGKVFDDKQKFSYTKDGTTLEYAIKDDQYLLKNSNGIYQLTDKLDTYFEYCDIDKFLSLIEDKITDSNSYSVTNKEIADIFGTEAVVNGELLNNIILEMNEGELKSFYIDLSNYIKSVTGVEHVLSIKMEFADIGKVEDFDIKMN